MPAATSMRSTQGRGRLFDSILETESVGQESRPQLEWIVAKSDQGPAPRSHIRKR